MEALFWTVAGLGYVGYPLLLYLLARYRERPVQPAPGTPSVGADAPHP